MEMASPVGEEGAEVLVRVTWRDAYSEQDEGEYEGEDFLVDTVGFLLPSNEYFINVAQERCPDGSFRGLTHIPRGVHLHTERLTSQSLQIVGTQTQ